MNRDVPNVILPPPLRCMVKAEKDIRLKPKRKQEAGKRGPMKAVTPVDSMTRASGIQKKGEEFLYWFIILSSVPVNK